MQIRSIFAQMTIADEPDASQESIQDIIATLEYRMTLPMPIDHNVYMTHLERYRDKLREYDDNYSK